MQCRCCCDIMSKYFGIAGHWGFVDAPKGISTYHFEPETGTWELIETVRQDIAAGQLCVNTENNMVYCVNEVGKQRDDLGGGGYIEAFRMDPESGRLTFVNEQKSLSPEPSYITLDKSGKFLAVCHCADPWHITKITCSDEGKYDSVTLYDDCALVLFRVNDDGSIGEVCDVSITPSAGMKHPDAYYDIDPTTGHPQLTQVLSRQHSVVQSPSGEMLIVPDKGMDRIYTYKIDRENGKLIQLCSRTCKVKDFPRYAVFHPTEKYVYVDNERAATVYAFRYDEETGELEEINCCPLLLDKSEDCFVKPVGAQDILIHPNGKFVYVSLEVIDYICTLQVRPDGGLELIQNIKSGGIFPRALCISQDGKYLFSGNMHSANITSFTIGKDGLLTPTGKAFESVAPSAIRIFSLGKKRDMFVNR